MSTGLKANADGSAAIQVGGSDAITITSGLDTTHQGASLSIGATGYTTGAGGTVTQLTSKSTAVTLNKPTGQITINNAALAAGATVSFSFNNSLISSNDMLLLNTKSWGGSYRLNVEIGSGSCFIFLTNLTGGSLSDSFVLNFAIIKGAAS